MCIQAETIKHSNTQLEHQNNFQKAKHKLHWDNWQAPQFIFRQANKVQPIQAQNNVKTQVKTLHATPPEGKQTASTHTQRDNASVQGLSNPFG